jgi:hypothetical protein
LLEGRAHAAVEHDDALARGGDEIALRHERNRRAAAALGLRSRAGLHRFRR